MTRAASQLKVGRDGATEAHDHTEIVLTTRQR